MKRVLICLAVVLGIAGAAWLTVAEQMTKQPIAAKSVPAMDTHKGTYRGFSPTDESAMGLGEIEIAITDTNIIFRLATGRVIHEETLARNNFAQMTPEQVAKIFQKTTAIFPRIIGFQGASGYPKLLFLKDAEESEFALIVRTGGMGDALGPTVLYSPKQVAKGIFEQDIRDLEKGEGSKRVLPRLANHGKAPEQ
jgi:hypothetical protein